MDSRPERPEFYPLADAAEIVGCDYFRFRDYIHNSGCYAVMLCANGRRTPLIPAETVRALAQKYKQATDAFFSEKPEAQPWQ